MKNILICGDSFAADWTVKYKGIGWPNLLAEKYNVTNLAQAGCCEYKIYKQIKSIDLSKFDHIIISHTSPYRLYVETHPVHNQDPLHTNSDLIYTDLKEHSITNNKVNSIIDYYENYFNFEYAEFTHNLICEKIESITKLNNTIHITNLYWNNLYNFSNMLNFYYLFEKYRGLMNHYTDEGNRIIFEKINALVVE